MRKLSYSSIKQFGKSPNHFLQYINREQVTTPAMIKGTAFHCLVLESEKFRADYAVAPKVDRRTKAGKETWANFSSENEGKEVITQQDWNDISEMAKAFYNYEHSSSLLSMDVEQHIEGKIQGIDFRGYADIVGDNYIADLKSCQDASPDKFIRDAFNMDYHLQAAIYLELTGKERYYIIAVESSAPYNVAVYEMSFEMITAGRKKLYELIEKFKEWDGMPETYSTKIELLTLPAWAK
jgi:exodeoxyribonuclease VIII